jgi:AAA domain
MSLLRFPLWAFFQPRELEHYASQSSARRKALFWGHIALYFLTFLGYAFALYKFHNAFGITLEDEIIVVPLVFTGAIYVIVGVLSLFFSGVLRKDNLTSFVIAVYWSAIGGGLLVSAMWTGTLFRRGEGLHISWLYNWLPSLLGMLIFILVWSLVSNIYGRTRRYWAVTVLLFAAACIGATTAYKSSEYYINAYQLVQTDTGRKYFAVINPPRRHIDFDAVLMISKLGRGDTVALIDVASGEQHDVYANSDEIERIREIESGSYSFNEHALDSLKSLIQELERDRRNQTVGLTQLKERIDSLRGRQFSVMEFYTVQKGLRDAAYGIGGNAREVLRSKIDDLFESPSFKQSADVFELGGEKYKFLTTDVDGTTHTPALVAPEVSVNLDMNKIIKVRRGSDDVSVPGNQVLAFIPLDTKSVYVQTNQGFYLIDLEKMSSAILKTQEWYQNPSHQTRFGYGYNTSDADREYALADGGKVYGLSPSGYFFTFDPQAQDVTIKPVFAGEVGFLSHRHLYYLILYYFALGLLLLYCGLYRVPSYLAECGLQFALAAGVVLRAMSPARAVRMSPLTLDHVSTVRLPFSRYLLRRLANDEPKVFVPVLTHLLTKTNRKRGAARASREFFSKNPGMLFEYVYRSLRVDGGSVLFTILNESRRESEFKELLRSYRLLLDNSPRRPLLPGHLQVLRGFADGGYQHAREVYLTYSIFEQFLKISDLQELAETEGVLDEILQINYGDLLNPQVIEVFNIVVDLASDLKNYEIVDSFRDKQYYLSEARIKLYDISARAKEALASPEREIVLEFVEGWQGIIVGESKTLRGPADLVLSLLSKSLAGDGDWQSVVVRVRNVGQSPAENIRVSLLGNENVSVLEPCKRINLLGIGDETQAEFSINPLGNADELRLYIDTTFDDFERKDKLRPFADIIKLSPVTQEYIKIPNPYIVGTPLQNAKVFFGRERALGFAVDNLSSGLQNNVLIFFGQRRVGKSSLLYRLTDSPLKEEYLFVYIDCQGFADADTARLLYRICQGIAKSAAKAGLSVEAPVLGRFIENTFLELDSYLDRIEPTLGDKKVALMFDEYEFLEYKAKDGSVSPELFNKLRNLMQHRNRRLAFIFVGTHRLTELTESYWSFLFNTALYHEIGSLNESEARALITEPVKGYLRYDNLVVDKILRVTGLHPYFIQVTCRLIVNFCNQHRKSYITLTDLNEILKEAVEGSTAHVKYLYNDFSTKPEQEMLSFLARLTDEAKLSATAQEITRFAVENKFAYDTRAVREILSALRNKKLVREEGERGELFGFEYEFLRIWIERHVRVQSGFVSVG